MKQVADLNRLYLHFNDSRWLELDPLGMVDPALGPQDFELISFVIAGLSYGRVEQIRKSFADLLRRLTFLGLETNGAGIAQFLKDPSVTMQSDIIGAFEGWKHRLNTAGDAALLLLTLSKALERRGTLCRFFQNCYQVSPKDHISKFCEELNQLSGDTLERDTKNWKGTGVSWFLSSPKDGSTCKRLLMWLRWMIRNDRVDPGIWHKEGMQEEMLPAPTASRLFYPLDTHVFRWCVENEIIKAAKAPTWKTVEAVTEYFHTLDPDDPVRYDFAICHLGMAEHREIDSLFEESPKVFQSL